MLEILCSADRSIGTFYLSRSPHPTRPDEWVYDVHIDGAMLMSSISPLSERELATRAIGVHHGTGPLRILVGGLGLGYTAQAALESPRAAEVRVVDLMDFVIHWCQWGLLPLSEQLNADRRLEIVQRDVFADLAGPAERTWDVIVVDVDHSPEMPLDPANLPFYTAEGQRRVREHLAPGGVLAVWSAHDSPAFAAALAEVYPATWREDVKWKVDLDGEDETETELHNVLFFGVVPGVEVEAEVEGAAAVP